MKNKAQTSEVCIIGLGEFGMVLGEELTKMGIDILGIDINPNVINDCKDRFALVYQLDAQDKKALLQAGINDINQIVVNVGHSLESGVLIAINLMDIGVKNIWMVANNYSHIKVYKRLGIKKVIFPEMDMALQVANKIYNPDFLQFMPFGRGIAVRELTVNKMADKTLIELGLNSNFHIQVIGIKRSGDRNFSLISDSSEKLTAGEKLIAVGQIEDFERLVP